MHDLRSSATITNDLAQAVRALGDELASEDSATFRLVVEGPPRDLHPILRDEIYRIAREALRNAFSHAQAHHIEAEITYGERLFRLRIRDDGQGIAPAILEDGPPRPLRSAWNARARRGRSARSWISGAESEPARRSI